MYQISQAGIRTSQCDRRIGLHTAPMGLQIMIMKLQLNNLRIIYVPGKVLHIADEQSRAHVTETGNPLVDEDLSVNMTDIIPILSQKII